MATLRQLKTFVATAEHKKMSEAAKHLYVSQPTISQIISDLEKEYDTVETREADPFYISPSTVERLKKVYPYWKGKTVSDLAAANMDPEVLDVFLNHGIFTVGNYFFNGVGHVNVNYEKVINCGLETYIEECKAQLATLTRGQGDYAEKRNFWESVIESCEAVITYARRYSDLALSLAADCTDSDRKAELLTIAEACDHVPAKPARSCVAIREIPKGCLCEIEAIAEK
mgnify:CR=1 FL=1